MPNQLFMFYNEQIADEYALLIIGGIVNLTITFIAAACNHFRLTTWEAWKARLDVSVRDGSVRVAMLICAAKQQS